MSLNLYYIDNGDYKRLDLNYSNEVGTPIINARLTGNNNEIAGIYEITFNSVAAGNTATMIVDCLEPKNPYEDLAGKTVDLDGTTWQKVIEGVEIQLSNSTSFDDTWKAKIYIGAYKDSLGNDIRITDFNVVVAGTSSTEQRIAVRNDGGDLEANCILYVVNGVRYENTDLSEGFTGIFSTERNPTKTADASSYYSILLSPNGDGTVDITVDGGNYDILDVETGVIYPGGAAVSINTSKVYEFNGSGLTGVRFKMSNITADRTVKVYVSDGSEHIYIAEDNNGVAGAYQLAENNFISLTEDGGTTTGEISAGATAFFWMKVQPSTTSTKVHNERYANIVIKSIGV